jgi:hypothetical protein
MGNEVKSSVYHPTEDTDVPKPRNLGGSKTRRMLQILAVLVWLVVMIMFVGINSFGGPITRNSASTLCKKPRIFVGVFTGVAGSPKYADRRAALRATWFPNTTSALERLECTFGINVRFVVGQSALTNDTKEWLDELNGHDDFLELDVPDGYHHLSGKTAAFFHHVLSNRIEYQYVVKMDDDLYLSPNHLARAVDQWESMHVDYAGCMTNPNHIYTQRGESKSTRLRC